MFGFERLDAWQLAVGYADAIYDATAAFPSDERFGLTNQLRRAAVSISANIAEGSGRSSKDFGRFIGIAYSSLMETVSHLCIAERRGFLDKQTYHELYRSADQIARVLSGLKNSIDPPH